MLQRCSRCFADDSAQQFVGADGERSRQRRRSATDAAHPLRVHIGPLFRYSPELPCVRQRRNCVSDGSSSQTPHPSPRRKRQVSSVPLLVLSKLQTLRWFAIWFRLSCQKRMGRKEALENDLWRLRADAFQRPVRAQGRYLSNSLWFRQMYHTQSRIVDSGSWFCSFPEYSAVRILHSTL